MVDCAIEEGTASGFAVIRSFLTASTNRSKGQPDLRKLCTYELAVQNGFWQTAVVHAANMSKPSQASLPQYFRQGGHLSAGKDLDVCHLVALMNAEDLAYTAYVEAIQPFPG